MPIYVGTRVKPSNAAVQEARHNQSLNDPFRRANIAAK